MKNFTLLEWTPSEETILFLKTFARQMQRTQLSSGN